MDKIYFEKIIDKMFKDYFKIYGNNYFNLNVSSKFNPISKWTISYSRKEIESIAETSSFAIEVFNNEIILQVNTSKANFQFEKFREVFWKVEQLLKGWMQRQF